MAGQDKRVIEQQATSEVFADDWFLKDSVTEGTTKISSENLKAWINDGMATEGDIETVVKNIADTYSESESYAEGDLCIHEYALFKCTGTTTGTWDSTKWQATTVAELLDSIDLSAEAISYDNTSSGLEAENVQDAIDETITKLSAVGSASGAIATFTDGSALPMPKLEVGIEPVQDLHGQDYPWVGGAGKNKFDIDAEHTSSPATYFYELIVKPNTAYTMSSNVPQSNPASLYFNGGTTNVNGVWSGTSKTFTSDENGKLIAEVRYNTSQGGIDLYTAVKNGTYYIQLEEGSTATTFAPYSNICPISGWSAVDVNVSGVNVWDEITESGRINTTTGENTTGIGERSKNPVPVKPSKTVYIKSDNNCFILEYGADKSFIKYSNYYKNEPFTTGATTHYIRFYSTVENGLSGVSINYPSTDTSYHAYNGNTYTIDLDGTRYGGKVDVVSGVMTVDSLIKSFDGTENLTTDSGNYFAYKISDSDTVVNDSAICSHFIENPNISASNNQTGFRCFYSGSYQQSRIIFRMDETLQQTLTEFKQYLASQYNSNNPVTVVYELATPFTVQLPTTVVKSLRGKNNVSADTGNILDAEYIRDLTTIIDYILEQFNS